MSCVDSEGKVSETDIGKNCSNEEVNKGKPCIDFQPDERWQIKEDAENHENVPNSKVNDINCSNGRRSQRLRSARSKDSSIVNGEAEGSNSDNDVIRNTNDESNVSLTDASDKEKMNSKRKQSDIEAELNSIQQSDNTSKKMKLNEAESTGDNEKCNGDTSTENCDTADVTDSNEKVTVPDHSSLTCIAPEESGNNSTDLNNSVEIVENENKESTSSENSCTSETKSLEVLDKAADDIKIKQEKDNDGESKSKETNYDADIEIISVTSKKVENDPDIQIINVDETESKSVVSEFPNYNSCDSDVSLTAGFPYYNSLKEKINGFKAGEYKPVKFPHTGTLLLAENEVIIESPSLLVPLLIKESDEFPKPGEGKKDNGDSSTIVKPNVISKKNFFQSSVGQFLINLGMSRVEEWYHRDMKRSKLKQLKSNKPSEEDLEKTVEFHEKRHNELKEINAAFNFRIRQCRHCNYKTESLLVMDGHLLTPHLSQRREFKCNFCVFLTRDPEQIKFHFEAMHGKKAIMEAEIPFYECIFCSFQTNLKTKINGHMNRCRKHFIPSQNLAPPFDFEFPGVTTKPVTIADVIGHRRLLLNSASAKNRQPMLEDANSAYARKKLASVLNKLSVPNAFDDSKNPNLMKQLMKNQTQLPPISAASNIQLPPGIVITRPRGTPIQQMQPVVRYPQPRGIQTIRGQVPRPRGPPYNSNITSAASHLASAGISITPVSRTSILPRTTPVGSIRNVTLTPISTASNRTVSPKPGPPQPVALFTNMAGSTGLLGQPQARLPVNVNIRQLRPAAPYQRLNTPPSQVVKGSSGNTFVVCEICDAYIKDLEELRTHMNWVHKVKIHPKMLVSRPPLNCQKCQWRFFTDQGLERHLLGAHGLVTTNMQEMANKNQDGGRCIICGAVFTYKLVSHMTQVHKVTLKPAHLSYKCTVCTATFTLYRLFESHVYNVHSGSAKRPADDSASEPPAKKIADDSAPKRCKECNVVTENMHEHVIKKHIKNCSVKLCRIEKCKKCLYSSDEMILIRMSDFGIDEDDSGDDSDSSDDSSDEDEDTKT
ncbi:MOG interacting and ectopic P-granules protein 1-like [Argiope bruennichi]|uniref:MOG interacting and ectopic P-granules protein 1-like n=1 Tax=Argiope bruennichi TaxID=94029 RepID=UPI00249433E7|nr:MOG interacting and ectopic P-granules protein 1-like [Argiope bruennichi]XP_055933718.1 MOG interacting and ectopic P-granules protein 1-like [Argiope bruennichi]XP_055933719.1 MOG interacting and ectopic P-granules protein 1-like [Argiope bruennichi]